MPASQRDPKAAPNALEELPPEAGRRACARSSPATQMWPLPPCGPASPPLWPSPCRRRVPRGSAVPPGPRRRSAFALSARLPAAHVWPLVLHPLPRPSALPHTWTHTHTHSRHTHSHTHIHNTRIHAYTSTHTLTFIHTHTRSHIHTHIHSYITHTQTHTDLHIHTHIHTNTPMCTHIHTHARSQTVTHTCSRTHIYSHVYTYTHTLAQSHSLAHTFTHSYTCVYILTHSYTLTFTLTCPLAHILAHSHTFSDSHTLTHALPQTLTHSPLSLADPPDAVRGAGARFRGRFSPSLRCRWYRSLRAPPLPRARSPRRPHRPVSPPPRCGLFRSRDGVRPRLNELWRCGCCSA